MVCSGFFGLVFINAQVIVLSALREMLCAILSSVSLRSVSAE